MYDVGMIISIDIPHPPSCLTKNGRRRTHWRTQQTATKAMRDDTIFLIRCKLSELSYSEEEFPWKKAHIKVHQHYANTGLDYDGLASAVAPAIDAFIDTGIIQDDSPRHIESYSMTANKVAHRTDNRIEVTISKA